MFFKECKGTIFSITFILFAAVMLLDYYTQYTSILSKTIQEPKAGQEGYWLYGTISDDDTNAVMQAAMQNLIVEYQQGTYVSYPFGYYKEVRLNDSKKAEMANVLSTLTGYDADDLLHTTFNITQYSIDEDGNEIEVLPKNGVELPVVSEQVTYDEFLRLMLQADDLIGGGSSYSESSIEALSERPVNYEEALEVYQTFLDEGIAPGLARLLCDYLCIFASLFPAFIAVAVWYRDKTTKMRDILWVKRSSSMKTVFARYGAIVVLCTLVILLIALVTAILITRLYAGESVKAAAFFKYAIIWVVPSIMASTAIGAFFTEATDTPVGILVMLVYWYLDINSSNLIITSLKTFTTLMPRHNSEFKAAEFQTIYPDFLTNRAFFAIVSLVLVLLTALIFERKRKGRWLRFDKISLRRKKEYPA
ncbi:MAG: hypothetical protein ACRC3H_08415 [Lachnospiraceae bacterium]